MSFIVERLFTLGIRLQKHLCIFAKTPLKNTLCCSDRFWTKQSVVLPILRYVVLRKTGISSEWKIPLAISAQI